MMILRRFVAFLSGCFLLALVPSNPLLAKDGQFEINQTVVTESGGFPYVITTSGSYILTGNLTVPASTTGISVQAEQVTIDLNGFAISGPFECNPGDCTGVGNSSGITTLGIPRHLTVINGQVNGFHERCISVAPGGRVENTHVVDCGDWGIVASQGSIVIGNRVRSVGKEGINLSGDATTVYAHNTVTETNQIEEDHFAIIGGRPTAGNICGDGSCSTRGIRRFYLTKTAFPADEALTACAAGFHMASLFELRDPGNLEYDTLRGFVDVTDQGSGPPLTEGYARTAFPFADSGAGAGTANCDGWGSSFITDQGTTIQLTATNAANFGPWVIDTAQCDGLEVWCIED
ncbi:MAG TPA: hypothetical protein VJ984_15660 [Xanthomonadales bacterium]|nr:hypothetical protein [Xanthomonadales bacterium]